MWAANCIRLNVVFMVVGVQSMQYMLCASFQGGPRPTPTCKCTWLSLTSPRLMTMSTGMPCGKFFAPMVSLLASSTSWRTCTWGHMPLCGLMVIWGTIFPSPVVCDRAMWLPFCFLMCSWTSSLRRPLGCCPTVGWRLKSGLEGSWCTPLARGPCLLHHCCVVVCRQHGSVQHGC